MLGYLYIPVFSKLGTSLSSLPPAGRFFEKTRQFFFLEKTGKIKDNGDQIKNNCVGRDCVSLLSSLLSEATLYASFVAGEGAILWGSPKMVASA